MSASGVVSESQSSTDQLIRSTTSTTCASAPALTDVTAIYSRKSARSISYSSVGSHTTRRSAQIIFDECVYDITDFVNNHPGGNWSLFAGLGTDVTETIDSLHATPFGQLMRSHEFRKRLSIRLVGKLEEPKPDQQNWSGRYRYQSRRRYLRPDPIARELHQQVYQYLRDSSLPEKKPFKYCIGLLVLFYVLYFGDLFFAFIYGSPTAAFLLGPIATFMAVNVGHTVIHGGFSRGPIVSWFGRLLWDLGGYSSNCWDIEHQNHHQAPHTNIDVQTSGGSIVRFFEHQEYRRFHRFQIYYIWFVLILYAPRAWIVHSAKALVVYKCVPMRDRMTHCFAKLIGFVGPILMLLYTHRITDAILSIAIFTVSMSYFSLFTLFIQHEHAYPYLPQDTAEFWSVRQIVTSASWRTNNRVFEWLLGYFNYHIEHHLFPGLDPALYPKIQPIVIATCQKYGIPYKNITYLELFRSQLRAWRKFSSRRVDG